MIIKVTSFERMNWFVKAIVEVKQKGKKKKYSCSMVRIPSRLSNATNEELMEYVEDYGCRLHLRKTLPKNVEIFPAE